MKTIDPELQKKFDIANKLFNEKKYKDSAKKYEDILIENNNSISIKNNLGKVVNKEATIGPPPNNSKNAGKAQQTHILILVTRLVAVKARALLGLGWLFESFKFILIILVTLFGAKVLGGEP